MQTNCGTQIRGSSHSRYRKIGRRMYCTKPIDYIQMPGPAGDRINVEGSCLSINIFSACGVIPDGEAAVEVEPGEPGSSAAKPYARAPFAHVLLTIVEVMSGAYNNWEMHERRVR